MGGKYTHISVNPLPHPRGWGVNLGSNSQSEAAASPSLVGHTSGTRWEGLEFPRANLPLRDMV